MKQRKPGDPISGDLFQRRPSAEVAQGGGVGRCTCEIDKDYVDPVAGPYQASWLAQSARDGGSPERSQCTGRFVLVQERLEEKRSVRAQALGRKLVRSGLIALGVVIAVVTALWGFVMIVLNESPRFWPQ